MSHIEEEKEDEKRQQPSLSLNEDCGAGSVSLNQVEFDSPKLAPGTVIAQHYEILSMIGHGSMGTVYKARHLLIDQIRAIKILHVRANNQIVRRFHQEAKATMKLSHTNIVRVFEFGMEPELEQPYLVMEFVEGESLVDMLSREGKLPEERALRMTKQLCEALGHSHSHGVIHRDLKPANIIVTKDNTGDESVKIVDFGIAKITSDDRQNLTQTGEVFGTPLYMSPEQCSGGKVDFRSDIYSLGCVVYECLTGKPPFQGASALATIMMHVDDDADINLDNLSSRAHSLILGCLVVDPDKRYQSMEQLCNDVQKVIDFQVSDDSVYEKVSRYQRNLVINLAIIALIQLGYFLSTQFLSGSVGPNIGLILIAVSAPFILNIVLLALSIRSTLKKTDSETPTISQTNKRLK
ncbi:MAG: serine/threonine protein kinase [Candidatus Obscuribacterales bacterium]|nr:serine/threonine protein kinase [Candidatus Obscuribacterales bacterium]